MAQIAATYVVFDGIGLAKSANVYLFCPQLAGSGATARPSVRLARKTCPLTDDKATTRPLGCQPFETPRRLKVSDIMGGGREVILEHGNQEYHLRITASGKLILTK